MTELGIEFSPHLALQPSIPTEMFSIPSPSLGDFPDAPVAGLEQARSVSFFCQSVHQTCLSHDAKIRKRALRDVRLTQRKEGR